ncbi:MAG: TetR/AcrR family transcriptional regulator [Tenuifilum sp.]|uniref:TetR/AcrR family transcriptional regulator n=1 Tax=Tenuifilum sp. TaxID=2760880 RepID=UPI001B730FF1|nr:TetR/AcrR family transcriptional regulator [Bacteroidales bacterium]HOK61264.1 TetR/AcrR family transcriptional regulator [Tenuifilum sp.]MBP9029285.1 TetR/AcrR family transcriptional regulator [Bacteroidales bacterium]HOK85949.1 TetR/AcrR family transcriptional regulator [Tenuifilum sp.]HON70303.1 TetR/AcrR family transcriptional regulator [Tenuifilum sp.]
MNQLEDSHKGMRENIVSAATEVFSRYGFKKTSMEDIARALRMGKSSIYYYFKGKEEIFQAVVDREANLLRVKVKEILESGLPVTEKLRSYVKMRMDLIKQLSNYMEILKNDDLMNLELTEKFRKKYDDEEITIVKQMLEEGINRNELKVKDLNLSALAIVTAMKGLEIPLVTSTMGVESLNMVIDDMLDILFYGIVKR